MKPGIHDTSYSPQTTFSFGKRKVVCGEYVLRGVPDGSIVIEVEGQGYLKQQKLVTVRDGEDLTGVDF